MRDESRRYAMCQIWMALMRIKPIFEDNHCGLGINLAFLQRAKAAAFKQIGTRFNGAQALVLQLDAYAKTTMQAIGELTCARSKFLFGAIHIQRQAHYHIIGLPLFQQLFDQLPVRRAVLRF